MSMVVETHQDPQNRAIPQHPERLQGGNIRAGGVIPHQITLMYGRNGPNEKNDCHFGPMMNPKASTPGEMDWGCAHRGITPRS